MGTAKEDEAVASTTTAMVPATVSRSPTVCSSIRRSGAVTGVAMEAPPGAKNPGAAATDSNARRRVMLLIHVESSLSSGSTDDPATRPVATVETRRIARELQLAASRRPFSDYEAAQRGRLVSSSHGWLD